VINDSTPSAVGEEPSIVPVVVGAVIGAIVAIALIVLFVWYVKMRRSRYHRDEESSGAAVMMSRAPSMQAIPNRTLEKSTGDYSSAPPPTYAGERLSGAVGGRPPSRYETAPPLEVQRYETAPPDARYDHAAPEQEERVMF
jgi:FtsZ-interacting cell division protein ZipA